MCKVPLERFSTLHEQALAKLVGVTAVERVFPGVAELRHDGDPDGRGRAFQGMDRTPNGRERGEIIRMPVQLEQRLVDRGQVLFGFGEEDGTDLGFEGSVVAGRPCCRLGLGGGARSEIGEKRPLTAQALGR